MDLRAASRAGAVARVGARAARSNSDSVDQLVLVRQFGRLCARVPDEHLRAAVGARLEIRERHLNNMYNVRVCI